MFDINIVHRLPFSFDASLLLKDLEKAENHQMYTHPLKYHDGNWKTLNLIYAGGRVNYDHSGDLGYGDEPAIPTIVLNECAYFQKVLDSFKAPILMARLSALPPGSKVLPHYDPVESADFGYLRIHIPIRTDKNVKFRLGFVRRKWQQGECWYGDFTFPHSVMNDSDISRVHLIVDLQLNDWAKALLPKDFEDNRQLRERFRKIHKNILWYKNRIKGLISK